MGRVGRFMDQYDVWCRAVILKASRCGKTTREEEDYGHTQGEVTSQNLWSRHDRHVVGITWRDVWSEKAKIHGVIHTKLII